jgi:hypothetical protein
LLEMETVLKGDIFAARNVKVANHIAETWQRRVVRAQSAIAFESTLSPLRAPVHSAELSNVGKNAWLNRSPG